MRYARTVCHLIALMLVVGEAHGQQFRKPAADLTPFSGTGAAEAIPTIGVPKSPALAAGRALHRLKDDTLTTRGAKEIALFKNYAPSVVLIVTRDGIGSGSLIDTEGTILTNWHVIEGNDVAAVIFRPSDPTRKIDESDAVKGTVVRYDEVADLALIKVDKIPAGIRPLRISAAAAIDVGADVSAIGHPTGETWTYTRGLVTQYRPTYRWSIEGIQHEADVIQTQTPINPGNSGGPLFDDRGDIVGVNTFISDGEGLNFAVASAEVRRFLAAKESRVAKRAKPEKRPCDDMDVLAKGHSEKEKANITAYDSNCDKTADVWLIIPDDSAAPISLAIDSNFDSEVDLVLYDENRDEKWDVSLTDTDGDGEPDVIGYHEDGGVEPTRTEKYEPKRAPDGQADKVKK